MQSGRVAGDTLDTIGNVVTATHNMKFMTPKGIAKQSVKATGKAMIEDIRDELNPNRPSLYPDLSTEQNGLPGPSTSTDVMKKS